MSESLFHNIPYFLVNPHNYLSDHFQISPWIRSDDYYGGSLIDLSKSFVFKNYFKKDFQVALCSSGIQTKITKINETIFPSDQADVNQANNLLSDIFMSAAEISFIILMESVKEKPEMLKEMVNGECESARKLVLLASKNKHRDPSNPTIRRSCNENLKHF